MGAFEVSTVVNGTDVLFYSKMMSGMWPYAPALAQRIQDFIDAKPETMSAAELKGWNTTGR